jgi:glycosyltransferase involved in cell wall biosynthesis
LQKDRKDFYLDLVGDGPEREKYEEMVKSFSLRDFVQFHGVKPKEYIAELMRKSFFFVLPSFSENLPCVLIEAMASGLPCVATNVGGIPELVNKERGILVEPGNSTALAEAIDYMLDHYKDYNSFEISDYAKNNFSYEAVGKKISAVYEDLLSRREK